MNSFTMTDRNENPPPKPTQQSRATDRAFDIWLNRGLHQLFDDVTQEPVPDVLMKIIKDEDKK